MATLAILPSVFSESAIARPAAASEALLMRTPEDNLVNEARRSLVAEPRFRCAFNAATLVLIVIAIVSLR
jgi:hypothetical protein